MNARKFIVSMGAAVSTLVAGSHLQAAPAPASIPDNGNKTSISAPSLPAVVPAQALVAGVKDGDDNHSSHDSHDSHDSHSSHYSSSW